MQIFQPTKLNYINNSVTIDWLKFSIPIEHITKVWELIGFSLNEEDWIESKMLNKKFIHRICDGVLISCESIPRTWEHETGQYHLGTTGDRFIVDFSGSGLATWHRLHGDTPIDLIRYFWEISKEVKVNRIDIAYDDHKGYLDLKKILKSLLIHRLAVTRWRTVKHHGEYNLSSSATPRLLGDNGATLYLGKRKSPTFCRIYDKREQELARDAEEASLPDHWIRLELEFKHTRAIEVAKLLSKSDKPHKTACEILRGQIDFKATKGEARIRDRPPVRWWERFTGSCGKHPIRVPRELSTIKRKTEWLEDKVSPTLALVQLHKQETEELTGVEWLEQLSNTGRLRLTGYQLALLQQHSS